MDTHRDSILYLIEQENASLILIEALEKEQRELETKIRKNEINLKDNVLKRYDEIDYLIKSCKLDIMRKRLEIKKRLEDFV